MGKLILNGKEYIRSIPSPFPPIIYSKEEREVGVWTDGKPLYEKVIIIPNTIFDDTGIQSYAHNIANIDTCVSIEGCIYWNNGDMQHNRDQNDGLRSAIYGFGTSLIQMNLGSTWADSQYKPSGGVRCIVKYTKTTDTPGSGKWTTQGTLSHHYSTNEQVVGTWIDGKPIYEKTIVKNNYRLEVGANQISLGVTNIEIIDSNVQVTNSSHTTMRKLNHRESSGTDNLYYLIYYVTGYINIYAEATWGTPNIYITIQYTKSTD